MRLPLPAMSLVILAACAAAPPRASVNAAPVTRELMVHVAASGSDPAADLGCTLVVPALRAPAVILLHGSGPSSRNYNDDARFDLQRQLVDHLAAAGVATLRCDARGTGRSTGRFWDGGLGTYVADARAMLGRLRAMPEVDGHRLGIVGHSEGGIVARVVADDDLHVRALALIASGARDFREAVVRQRVEEAQRAGADAAMQAQVSALTGAVLDAVAAGDALPSGIPDELRAQIIEQTPWLRSRLAFDVRASTRALRHLAILIQQGGRDAEVPPDEATVLAGDLRAGHNPDARVIRYPTLNHHLAPGEPTELPGAPIDDAAMRDTAAFLSAALR